MDRELSYQRGIARVQELQAEALHFTGTWLDEADDQEDPKRKADLALAAKNAASVAVSCETILKVRNGGGR
ncbi:MAG TPA: hypothetical protein VJW23_07890 [Propionibacteriaceae bacterium]|nr:hypothetical protein [Propionibacteriaceae bacterium]